MPALLGVCNGILVTAVLFGITTLGGLLPRLASPAELGLGSNRVGIDRFIDQVLGPGSTNSGPTLERVVLRGRGGGGPADDAAGEVVDHPGLDGNGGPYPGLSPGNFNNGDLLNGDVTGIETELVRVSHCMDVRVDVVNYLGLPPDEMTLGITLEGVA